MEDLPWRRILLIGFMGSGKSTVGRLLAKRVGWSFTDADRHVEKEAGRRIPQIFREDGEEGFRRIERRVMRRLLGEDGRVIATGGGWPCRSGRLDRVPGGSLSIWLSVSPEAAFQRVSGDRKGGARPLLEVDDPPARIQALIEEREPYYRRADWWVVTDRARPKDIVQHIAERLEGESGRWPGV